MRGRRRVPVSPAAFLIFLAALFGLVYEAGGTGSAPPAPHHVAAAAQRPVIVAAAAVAEHAPSSRAETGAVFLVNHTQAASASVDRPAPPSTAPLATTPPADDPALPTRRGRPVLPPDAGAPPDRLPAHDRPARAPPSDTGF
ncbi:hypothetical protein [Actinomadura miaoliensis]|uniref:Uncharacterized protein n=1 Tax=Actinomadura miaoliensis TaxID=430685 RepID=A0ABP7W2T2_9ACTN